MFPISLKSVVEQHGLSTSTIPKEPLREKNKPGCGCIIWEPFKWTVNIPEYGDGKDEVNPAKNRTLGGKIHGRLRERSWCMVFGPLDSRLWSRLRGPVGRFHTKLPGILRVQPLPAAE